MNNLHKISNNDLSDEIKLAIVNWHISSINYPARRIGKVEFRNNKFYIWQKFIGTWKLDTTWAVATLDEFINRWGHRGIPLSYFKEDMVYRAGNK